MDCFNLEIKLKSTQILAKLYAADKVKKNVSAEKRTEKKNDKDISPTYAWIYEVACLNSEHQVKDRHTHRSTHVEPNIKDVDTKNKSNNTS